MRNCCMLRGMLHLIRVLMRSGIKSRLKFGCNPGRARGLGVTRGSAQGV